MGHGLSKNPEIISNQNQVENSSKVHSAKARKDIMTPADASSEFQEFALKKRRPGCTGMFWRSDPTGLTKLASNNDWPRDGAKLRGEVVTVNGEKWLLAMFVKQTGGEWKKAPTGAAVPFEYNNHYYLE